MLRRYATIAARTTKATSRTTLKNPRKIPNISRNAGNTNKMNYIDYLTDMPEGHYLRGFVTCVLIGHACGFAGTVYTEDAECILWGGGLGFMFGVTWPISIPAAIVGGGVGWAIRGNSKYIKKK